MKWRFLPLAILVFLASLAGRSSWADPPKSPPGVLVVDAGQTREPMSKYIYGQFIEHLGRCIYGGIWAEMLEDRKFFLPVGFEPAPSKDKKADRTASPWKVLGGADGVSMETSNPFVGEHTPKIAAPGGIVQGELALRKGKEYVGRIWLAGDSNAAPVKVSLAWGDGPSDRQTITIDRLTPQYAQASLEFTAAADADQGRLEIVAAGKGNALVGTVSLMPADNIQGMRADTIALLKELDAPVYRWPGGNFVSGYHWKDGIGDRDRRPPRKNMAWKGIEHNDFGMDEFMVFCRTLGTEPYIAVNSGLGDVQAAAEEVQYANGAADTPQGAQRAKNGHAEPYHVKWWSIGNEMYGKWQLGHMPLEQYVLKHNQFAQAMRAVDPAIKLIGVGNSGPWSESMLTHCADQMDLISEHFYCHAKEDLAAHVRQIPDAVRSKAAAHHGYREHIDSLKGKDIRIALDEWNYWYGAHIFGELGTRYLLRDALGIAAGLNEYSRQSDIIFMANYAQTVNVIGCIKTTKTAAAFETTGLALKLYRQHFGTLPVAATADAPLDVAAAWTADRQTLTVAIVNPTRQKLDLPWQLRGAKLTGAGRRWQIAGDDPLAYNDPGQPPKVTIEETAAGDVQTKLPLAPCSVTLYALGAAAEK